MAPELIKPEDLEPIISKLESLNNQIAYRISTANCMAKALIEYSDACANAANELKKKLHACNGDKPDSLPEK